jgi:hypothetical protein
LFLFLLFFSLILLSYIYYELNIITRQTQKSSPHNPYTHNLSSTPIQFAAMIHPIQALSAYIYKYCDKTSSRHVNDQAITQVSHNKATRALTAPQVNTSDVCEPPPYGDVLPPPAYQTIVGRLCLIDRTDQTFKIYQTDLMMLSREWTRRSQLKRDALESVSYCYSYEYIYWF